LARSVIWAGASLRFSSTESRGSYRSNFIIGSAFIRGVVQEFLLESRHITPARTDSAILGSKCFKELLFPSLSPSTTSQLNQASLRSFQDDSPSWAPGLRSYMSVLLNSQPGSALIALLCSAKGASLSSKHRFLYRQYREGTCHSGTGFTQLTCAC